jgi:hypothetical protein
MKWPYFRYEVDRSPICPDGVVYRPEARLCVPGNIAEAIIGVLIDTGADHTVFPIFLARRIGARLYEDQRDSARGVGGHGIEMIPGVVELELVNNEGACKWTAVVGFAEFDSPDDECSILGHAGCLEYFLASFDGVERVVELVQIGDFPSDA